MAKKRNYKNASCCECGSRETYVYQNNPKWYNCQCGRKDCTKFLCNKCYMKKKNDSPDSHKNLRKELGKFDKLNINSESGKGILGECIVANILGIRNCDSCQLSKKDYNWGSPFDIEKDNIRIQVKVRAPWYGQYSFNIGDSHDFDILFILCLNDSIDINIKKVYTIPEYKVTDVKGITIYDESSTGDLYEEFMYEDIKLYNNILSYILQRLKNCRVLKSG